MIFLTVDLVSDLGDFSNVPDAAVNAKAYEGVAIQCSKITYKPGTYPIFSTVSARFKSPLTKKAFNYVVI